MAQPPQPETIIDARYRVVRLLGEGGFGQVFECRHVGTRRPFAVKLLLPEIARRQGVLTRFLREAQTAGSIKSPNVADVIDVGQCRTTGAAFMAMELLDGHDLAKQLEEHGPLPPEVVLRIAAQALEGIRAAHAEGIVHRDIKPPNLFLSRAAGGQRLVKVLDFGIAKVLGDDGLDRAKLTVTGSILGSPWYMSPEQAAGLPEIDHRTDIWSLGAVLYEALSGVTPYHGVTTLQQLLRKICDGPPRPVTERVPSLSPALGGLVGRAMAHDPRDRFQSAVEMLDAVHRLLEGPPVLTDAMLSVGTAPAEGRDSAPAPGPGTTQPMPGAIGAGTQGGLARTSAEGPRSRTFVIGAVAAAVSATAAVLALVLIPKPGARSGAASDVAPLAPTVATAGDAGLDASPATGGTEIGDAGSGPAGPTTDEPDAGPVTGDAASSSPSAAPGKNKPEPKQAGRTTSGPTDRPFTPGRRINE